MKSNKGFFLGRLVAVLFLLMGLGFPGSPGRAQTEPPPAGPVYIVQGGDSLWEIALRFGVTLGALEGANAINDPNQLAEGMRLVIPGLEGIQGILTTYRVGYGENLVSLSRRYSVPVNTLIRLNHLTSPAQLFAGASLVVLEPENPGSQGTPPIDRAVLAPGQSLLELAVLQAANPWNLVTTNALSGTWSALPGEVLQLPAGQSTSDGPGALPGAIQGVDLRPLPGVQGQVVSIKVAGQAGMALGGSLAGHNLNFFSLPPQAGSVPTATLYVAMQGLHALLDTGLYPLEMHGALPGGASFAYSQSIFVRSGDYPYDPVLSVSPETIDPAVTRPEDAEWAALMSPVTPEKQWEGGFTSPVAPPFDTCFPSRFGNRRSYNGSAYTYFHSGLDFCGGVGTEIHAPAAGTVVFAGPLTVRGNATVIDHGWGVYSAYLHQSEIMVQVGERVAQGQTIGLVGGTGRVTGPHLHWEIWAGGVQVDPMPWLANVYP